MAESAEVTKTKEITATEDKQRPSPLKVGLWIFSAVFTLGSFAYMSLNNGFDSIFELFLENEVSYQALSPEEKQLAKDLLQTTVKKGLSSKNSNEKELKQELEKDIGASLSDFEKKAQEKKDTKEKENVKQHRHVIATPTQQPTKPEAQAVASSSEAADFPELSSGEVATATRKLMQLNLGDFNPYLGLPNPMQAKVSHERSWTQQEQDQFVEQMMSHSPWQRYQAVQQIHELKLAGSIGLLWEATSDSQFWVRIEALRGLTDAAIPVSLNVTAAVLSNTPEKLVLNYLKRFSRKPSQGDFYLLRQALGLTPPQTRSQIITLLWQNDLSPSLLHIAAALHDGDYQVRLTAEKKLATLPATQRLELESTLESYLQATQPAIAGVEVPSEYDILSANAHDGFSVKVLELKFYNKNKP